MACHRVAVIELGGSDLDHFVASGAQLIPDVPVFCRGPWVAMYMLAESVKVNARAQLVFILAGEEAIWECGANGTTQADLILPLRLGKACAL